MKPAVAAGAPGTVGVALDVLARGGNAVDAAVAAAFAMPVTEPGLASLGGGGFMIVRGSDGESTLIDFFAAVPTPRSGHLHRVVTVEFAGARQNFAIGSSTVAVPGVLPGLIHAHNRFGRLTREEVVAPAIGVARVGVAMTSEQALVLQLIGAVLTSTTESARVFAPKGELLRAGESMRNPYYAAFLREVIAGLEELPAIGPLHVDDMAAYEVFERAPLRVELPGATLLTNPPPSLGGSIIAHALTDLADIEAPTALDLLNALRDATDHNKALSPVSVRGTTHISVTDGEQTVAMTVSNGSCSGVMLPGTGIQMNNMMGESDLHPDGQALPVGARIRSMMAPSILQREGLVTALGTGGSERIRSAMVRVIAQLVRDVGLQEAIDAPRVHLDNDAVVQLEPGFPLDQVAALPQPLSIWDARDFYFGGVHAVSSDGSAGCDARRGGHVGSL